MCFARHAGVDAHKSHLCIAIVTRPCFHDKLHQTVLYGVVVVVNPIIGRGRTVCGRVHEGRIHHDVVKPGRNIIRPVRITACPCTAHPIIEVGRNHQHDRPADRYTGVGQYEIIGCRREAIVNVRPVDVAGCACAPAATRRRRGPHILEITVALDAQRIIRTALIPWVLRRDRDGGLFADRAQIRHTGVLWHRDGRPLAGFLG